MPNTRSACIGMLGTINMKPFAFLFNADHKSLGAFYGQPCTAKILHTLELSKINIYTQILRGDILPHLLCYNISSISTESDISIKARSVSRTMTPDMTLYKTILCDFADTLNDKWCTIDTIKLPFHMANNRIWAIVLPTISLDSANEIESLLKSFSPYLGGTQIDLGNPIHIDLFSLIDGAFFKNGTLFYGKELLGEPSEDYSNAKSYGSKSDPVLLEFDAYNEFAPPSLVQTNISSRGRLSITRFKGKSELSHRQKLAITLLEYLEDHPEVKNINYSTELAIEHEEFVCDENKIKNYLLNIDHPDGKSKAKFFIKHLGIERDDWKYLSDQIIGGMRTALLFRVKNSKHGINYGAILEINGRNGTTAIIQTGWMIKSNESARLITAYPYSEDIENNFSPPLENVSPSNLKGDDKWKDIYNRAQLAGASAANNCIPTPITISDYPTIFFGACGFAKVTVFDVRTGMAKWLKKNKIGRKNYKSGWDVSANPEPPKDAMWDTQSIEPKKAYADAFANTLKKNGVDCKVESHLD